ncbi:MAG: cupin domain-containing protein [Hyphomicrobiaceae bacterium]
MAMQIVDHEHQSRDEWRPGVMTRMRVSSTTGTAQVCVFEQWCDPGLGAPTHLHAVEEILSVLAGEAEVWLDDERRRMTAGQSFVVPAGRKHGFTNVGTSTLHVMAILASPVFEAAYDDKRETPRRWLPEAK